jgi:hypothetical protein
MQCGREAMPNKFSHPVVILNWHKRCSELRAINYSEQLLGGEL